MAEKPKLEVVKTEEHRGQPRDSTIDAVSGKPTTIEQRTALWLRLQGMSFGDIAKELGVSKSIVVRWSQIHRWK